MPTPAYVLEQAALQIAAGNVRRGARLAYDAAFAAVAAAANANAAPCATDADAMRFLHDLDGLTPNYISRWYEYCDSTGQFPWPIPRYTPGFDIARSFKEHAETSLEHQADDPVRYWRPDEYATYLPVVADLIQSLQHARITGVNCEPTTTS